MMQKPSGSLLCPGLYMKGRIMYTAARVNWAVVYDAKTIRQSSIYSEELCTQLQE